MSNTTKKKKLNFRMVFALLINIILIATTGIFIYQLLRLNGIETVLRIIFSITYPLIILLLLIGNFKYGKKSKKIKYVFLILLSVLFITINTFGFYSINKVMNTLNKVSKKEEVVSISLVTLKNNNIKLSQISKDDKIAAILGESSDDSISIEEEFKIKNNINNELVFYESYFEIMDELYDNKIKYAFLPTDYETVLSSQEEYSDASSKITIIKTYEKTQKLELTAQKKVTEPFTVLLMGVDTLSSSYNADTLMVVTFNPETLSATMLSIPRDTYTTISCTGRKHKINSSGWSGDKCVVSTIEKYLDIDIDYYAKVNFKGVVQLVDLLGGIEVDVPYTFCEQNSKRKWGKNTVYVEKGIQKLNGEQALALTRNRHYWPNKCSKKYTTEGTRNDFVRGQNQQLVFKSILNQMKNINSIDTIYKMLDSLGDNMVTNMSTDTMLSLYNVGKDILLKVSGSNKDISQILNIQKLKFTSYTKTIKIGNLNLSTVINYDDSVKKVTTAMKKNLGLIKPDVVKTFEFDVNDNYKETVVGSNTYGDTSDIVVLPNFVGKAYSYVESWTEINGLELKTEYKYVTDSKYFEGEVIEQSVKKNTDISTIKSIKVVVATKKDNTSSNEELSQEFTYNQCLEEAGKNIDKCIIKNYVGDEISVFKNWLASTGLTIPVEYSTVEGTSEKITGQNISGISIYELINSGKTLEITYSIKKETPEPTPPKEEDIVPGLPEDENSTNEKDLNEE